MSGTQNSRASNTFAASLAHRFERTIRELTDINPKRFFAHAFGQTVSAGEGCLDEYQDHAGSSRRTLCVFHSPAGIPVTAPMTTATAKAFQPTHPSARNTVTAAPAMHRTQSGMNISLQPCFMIFLHSLRKKEQTIRTKILLFMSHPTFITKCRFMSYHRA